MLPRTAKDAERIAFSNSRTLPGQGCSNNRFAAAALNDFRGWLGNPRKYSANRRISEPRSRSAGNRIANSLFLVRGKDFLIELRNSARFGFGNISFNWSMCGKAISD